MTSSISRDIKLFISHPFCLPTGSCPVSRYERLTKFEQLSKSLNSQGHEWNLFDIDGLLPAVLKKRKDHLLRTPEVENEDIKKLVQGLNKSQESTRKVISVKHSSYYWDMGMGAVCFEITLRLESPEGLTNLYPLAEDFEEAMFEREGYLPPGFDSWPDVQKAFTKAFSFAGMKPLSWLTSPKAQTYCLETCCWNVLIVADSAGIAVSQSLLDQTFVEFCGEKTGDGAFETGVSEILGCHVGYSGNIAIAIDAETGVRIMWLWRVVALLYGTLLESVEPSYDLVTDLIQGNHGERMSQDIRQVRMVIDILHNEAAPITICSESFDALIYEQTWEKWGGDFVDGNADKRTEYLASALSDIQDQQSQSLQSRLNFVVFVLTLVSVASTIASVIALIDASNAIGANDRILVLAILTGIVGLLCAVVVMVDFRYLSALGSKVKDVMLSPVSYKSKQSRRSSRSTRDLVVKGDGAHTPGVVDASAD